MPANSSDKGYEGQIRCGHCNSLIPLSEAYQPEGEEYTLYFCGLACYHNWRRQICHVASGSGRN